MPHGAATAVLPFQRTTGYAGATSGSERAVNETLRLVLEWRDRNALLHPRPMNGILVAITVMNCTLASSGRFAM